MHIYIIWFPKNEIHVRTLTRTLIPFYSRNKMCCNVFKCTVSNCHCTEFCLTCKNCKRCNPPASNASIGAAGMAALGNCVFIHCTLVCTPSLDFVIAAQNHPPPPPTHTHTDNDYSNRLVNFGNLGSNKEITTANTWVDRRARSDIYLQ